ncbi:hypothetical protein ACPOL_2804 [Acidisarcina polymorpha]|uniref:Uncharacterized protein n=1 Tax=Acidisarcina polymorpha TaxID=2211140 RepID=A0A2Z5FZ78_9BACT|nr:hypothetical protein ACPOL_2804 [Acidisarcina polymorpha]
MRSNPDASPHDAPPTMQNKPAFHSGAGIRAAAPSLSAPLAS